ncbi:MAG: hypothetical protein KGQ58_07615 [Proteobacteria bacterium]|nr:hypothetical protein [Pseudomonadota bacterium]
MNPVLMHGGKQVKAASLYRRAGVCTVLLALGSLSGCVTPDHQVHPVQVARIVKWSQAGVSSRIIIHRLERTHSVYRLSHAEYATLQAEEVDSHVIWYMQQTHPDLARQRQEAYYGFHWH